MDKVESPWWLARISAPNQRPWLELVASWQPYRRPDRTAETPLRSWASAFNGYGSDQPVDAAVGSGISIADLSATAVVLEGGWITPYGCAFFLSTVLPVLARNYPDLVLRDALAWVLLAEQETIAAHNLIDRWASVDLLAADAWLCAAAGLRPEDVQGAPGDAVRSAAHLVALRDVVLPAT